MDSENLSAVVAATLEADGGCFWRIDTAPRQGSTIYLSLNPDFSDPVTLFEAGNELFLLTLNRQYSIAEFEYVEEDQPEVVELQLRRALDYIHGRCTETDDIQDGVLVSHSIAFPDGTAKTYLWLGALARLRWRLTGRKPRPRTKPTGYSFTRNAQADRDT